MDCWKLTQHVALQKWSSRSHKMWLWNAIMTLCQSAQLSFGKNSWNSTRTTIFLKLQISDILHRNEFPSLLSVYSTMESFTNTAKSSVHIQKSSDKSVFPISQPNIHNSVSSRKSSIRIEIPLKFNKTRPTHKSYKVSSKVHLINANRVLGKDVLKPRCITTCNLTHKATTIPHVKLSIRNSFNN